MRRPEEGWRRARTPLSSVGIFQRQGLIFICAACHLFTFEQNSVARRKELRSLSLLVGLALKYVEAP
jgi:hypothetical protein